ncbi:MAG: hypothetical protein HY399_04510, partial [Elusimicrobia bacterium]|nr:hypothetical protein [Elusimicrobiota bacterium]
MMSLKKFLAGVSLFSLLWTIPGFGAYQAVAQMAGGRGTNYSLGSAAVNVNAGNSVMPQAPFVGPAADMQAYDFFNRTAPVQAPQAVRARETAAAPMGVMPIRASIPSSVSRVSALGASVGAKISAVVSSVGALLRSNTPESRAVVASGEEMRARGNSFDGARSRREISDPMVQGAMSLSAADSSGGGSSRSGRSNKESARPLKPTPDQKGQDFSQIQPVRIQEEDGQLVMTGNFNRSLSATVRVMLNGVARAEHFQVSFQLFGLRGSQVRNMTPGELNGLRDALETYLQGFERPDQRPVNSKEIQLYKQMKGEAERILRNQGDFSKFAPTKIERDGRKSSTMYGKLGTSFVGTVFYSVSEKMFRVSLRRVGIIYAGLRARPMTRLELTDLEGALAKFIESLPEDSPNYNAYMDMAIAIGAKVGIKREPQDPTLDKLNFSELVPTGISRVDGTLSMWGVFVKLEDMMRPPSPDSRVSVQISHRIEGLSHSFDFYVQVLSSPGAMKEGPNVKMNLAQLSGLQRALQKHLTQRTYDPDTDTLRFYQRMLAEVSAALLKRSEDSRGDSASGGTRNERGNSVVSALLVLWGSLVVSTVAITAFGAAGLLSPATLLLAAASAGVGGLTVFRIAEKSGFAGIGKPLPNTLGTAAIGIILGLIGGAAVGAPFFTTAVTVLGVIYGATGVWSLTKGIRTSSIDREMGGFFSVILSGLAAAGLGFLGHFFGGSLATLLALPFHHASLVGAVPLLGMALLPGKFKFPKIGSGAGNERGQASMAAATAVVGLVLGFVVGLLCGSPGVGAILGAVIGGVIGSLSDRRSGGNGSGTRNERGSASGLLLGFGVGVAIIIASVALQSYLGKEISFVGVFVGFIVAGAFMLKAGPGGNSGSSQRGSIPVNAVTVLLSG